MLQISRSKITSDGGVTLPHRKRTNGISLFLSEFFYEKVTLSFNIMSVYEVDEVLRSLQGSVLNKVNMPHEQIRTLAMEMFRKLPQHSIGTGDTLYGRAAGKLLVSSKESILLIFLNFICPPMSYSYRVWVYVACIEIVVREETGVHIDTKDLRKASFQRASDVNSILKVVQQYVKNFGTSKTSKTHEVESSFSSKSGIESRASTMRTFAIKLCSSSLFDEEIDKIANDAESLLDNYREKNRKMHISKQMHAEEEMQRNFKGTILIIVIEATYHSFSFLFHSMAAYMAASFYLVSPSTNNLSREKINAILELTRLNISDFELAKKAIEPLVDEWKATRATLKRKASRMLRNNASKRAINLVKESARYTDDDGAFEDKVRFRALRSAQNVKIERRENGFRKDVDEWKSNILSCYKRKYGSIRLAAKVIFDHYEEKIK